ncbi:MAG: transposase [Myxococcales bacterium]
MSLLAGLMGQGDKEVSPAEVVSALTIQRCIAPGSKLYAERWFPRTALPELLGIGRDQFNNTRLHRVLEQLDEVTPALQERLPSHCLAQTGTFTSLLLDVTDTWFVGQGPDGLAQKAKTKEGLYQRKIGIVLMCNQDGFPLRWQVISGRQSDSTAMLDVIGGVQKVDWVREAPVVCDRALGKTAHLRKLLATGLRFVTALTEDEFAAYAPDQIPHAALEGVELTKGEQEAARQAGVLAAAAGMRRVSDSLFVADLGVVQRREVGVAPQASEAAAGDALQRALAQATSIRQALDQGSALNSREAGRAQGLQKERAVKLLELLNLAPDLQDDIRAGRMLGMPIRAALRAACLGDPQEQRASLDRETRRAPRPERRPAVNIAARQEEPLRVRAVVCFNPEQFVEQRLGADTTLAHLRRLEREMNEQLAAPGSRRTRESAYSELDRELRRRSLVEAFEIAVTETADAESAKVRLQVELKLRPHVWRRLRRYDGFSVVVAHPESLQSGEDLAATYRSRDAVEKDFHVIKSLVELRPVRHRTEAKVRAHVTLCVLAMLLERALERKLAGTAAAMSAARAFEELESVRLNRLQLGGRTASTITNPNPTQTTILKALGLERLACDDEMAPILGRHPVSVSTRAS